MAAVDDSPGVVSVLYCISFALLLIPTVAKWSEAQFNFCTAKTILCTCFNGYNKYAYQKFQNILYVVFC